MVLDLSADSGSIEIFQSLPDHLEQFHIPAAETIVLQGDGFHSLFHEFRGKGFSAWYNRYHISSNCILKARGNQSLLELRCALENQLEGEWDGIDSPGLPAGYFNLSFTPHVDTCARFMQHQHCTTFDIHFEREFFERVRCKHPEIDRFLQSVDANLPVELVKKPVFMPGTMLTCIHEIIDNPFSTQLQTLVLESNILKIVTIALHTGLFIERTSLALKPHQRDTLNAVRQFIEQNEIMDIYTNDMLCKKFHISEEILLVGFRQLFDTTPYEYYMLTRFREVERLLRDTEESISSIALKVGYLQVQNLYKVFNQRYHCTPLQWRKQSRE